MVTSVGPQQWQRKRQEYIRGTLGGSSKKGLDAGPDNLWSGPERPYHIGTMWPALRAFVVLGLLVAASVTSAPARAQGTKAGSAGRAAAVEKARDHFQQGQRLYTVSRYREALEQFKNAFLAVEDPVFLYNIAQCHRLLGEKTEAARFYRRYIEAAPSGSERGRAEKWIAELEATPDTAPAPVSPAPAPVSPAPAPVVTAPKPTPAPVTPPAGTSPPVAAASGPPASPPPMGSGPSLEPPPVTGEPAPGLNLSAPPPADTEPRPIYKKWWFWAGVGAVVVVGGVVAAAAAKGRGVSCGAGVQRCEQL